MRSYPTKFIAGALLLAAALPAWAALGGAVSSVETDRMALRGTPAASAQAAAKAGAVRDGSSAAQSALYSVQAFALPNGTEVREFVAGGQVFGVAWQGASQPNLRQVFGDQMYGVYLQALKAQSTPGSRTFVLQQSSLVVRSFGLPGNFSGQAYLPQQLPAGVSAAAIK